MENGTTKKKQPNYPCRGCVYFKACGENTRTMPCEGRQTKTETKRKKGDLLK